MSKCFRKIFLLPHKDQSLRNQRHLVSQIRNNSLDSSKTGTKLCKTTSCFLIVDPKTPHSILIYQKKKNCIQVQPKLVVERVKFSELNFFGGSTVWRNLASKIIKKKILAREKVQWHIDAYATVRRILKF